ncbi:Putative sugar diacid recognition [Bacillus sp. UNCCL13]|nr:sugar diacid recognition domain-containing protein [Bacillus sp. cl95]SFA77421.1 Putative sugar diacid recognition [Bacillus sp. UNCCL13]
MLLPDLAEKIVREVRKLIGEDIIVVDTEGIIIASTDFQRVGTFHEGALIALRDKRKLIISKVNQDNWIGVKAGINLPVFFKTM